MTKMKLCLVWGEHWSQGSKDPFGDEGTINPTHFWGWVWILRPVLGIHIYIYMPGSINSFYLGETHPTINGFPEHLRHRVDEFIPQPTWNLMLCRCDVYDFNLRLSRKFIGIFILAYLNSYVRGVVVVHPLCTANNQLFNWSLEVTVAKYPQFIQSL